MKNNFDSLLCCPLCKADIQPVQHGAICYICGTFYPHIKIHTYSKRETVIDFRMTWRQKSGETYRKWKRSQRFYEPAEKHKRAKKNKEEHVARLNREKPIYEEFKIGGKVLDVGGHRGRIRQLLGKSVDQYISIDPYIDVFENIQNDTEYISAYPCVKEPLNFVPGVAEYLPFKSNTFDWVHMRSSIDHFENPLLAFKEAYRVLNSNGRLFVAVCLREKRDPGTLSARLKKIKHTYKQNDSYELFFSMLNFMKRQLNGIRADHHIWTPDYTDLRDALNITAFEIEHIYWGEKGGQWINLSARPILIME